MVGSHPDTQRLRTALAPPQQGRFAGAKAEDCIPKSAARTGHTRSLMRVRTQRSAATAAAVALTLAALPQLTLFPGMTPGVCTITGTMEILSRTFDKAFAVHKYMPVLT